MNSGPPGRNANLSESGSSRRRRRTRCSAPRCEDGDQALHLGGSAVGTAHRLDVLALEHEGLESAVATSWRAREDPYRIARLNDATELCSYSVLIATGVEVRRLDVPGIDALTGAGVYYGGAMHEYLETV